MKYSLNYDYNEYRIRFFLSNDSGQIFINEFINYFKWSNERLKYLDSVVDDSINKLLDRCYKAIPNLEIDISDKINTKYKAKEDITRMVKENNNKLYNQIKKLDKNIKSWYIETYPSDEVGKSLYDTSTFLDLNNLLNSGNGRKVYALLGGDADSIVRERCFEKLAELTNQDYNNIYCKWLGDVDKELEEELEK